MAGITAYGTYIPRARLDRATIGTALRTRAGRGTRAVASYDEDTTSLGVEAAQRAIGAGPAPAGLLFATTQPAYLDKTNATAVHAAVGLDEGAPAYDMLGSVRSGIGALRAALDAAAAGRPTLAVLSDIRTGLPASAEEANGGDGAAAFVCGTDDVVAELVGAASSTAEFLDRWRLPGDTTSSVWEERFGDTVYGPLAEAAVGAVCKEANVSISDVDHLVVTGLHDRAVRRVAKGLGVVEADGAAELASSIGNTGCAHIGISLADVLDRAEPGQLVLVVSLSDGADALLLRTTAALPGFRTGRPSVRAAVEAPTIPIDYTTFLTWRGVLRREPPRRPDPARPAAPASFRSEDWKFAFVAGRCLSCGTRHLPPGRVCMQCGAVDQMAPERLVNVPARVTTFTTDHLAYTLSPPVVVAVVDFEGGGRYQCEMTDVDPSAVAIGDRVEMTFRRFFTASGVHNYFWKARPVRHDDGGHAR